VRYKINTVRYDGFKKYKNTLFYLTVTGGFTVLIYWIITKGKLLEGKNLIVSETGNGSWNDFISSMKHNFDDFNTFFAQIVMIILVARLLVGFSRRLDSQLL
jgi:hypothetical protein